VLAGTVAGAFLSTDGGETFTRTTPSDVAVLAIAQDPRRPERVLLGTEGGGVWRSDDGGASFASSALGMTHLRVGATVSFRGQLVAAVHHAGPASGLYVSADGGRTFTPDAGAAGLPPVLDLARAGDRLLAATERGLYEGAPGTWREVAGVPALRIEQVVVEGERWLARTASAVYEGHAGKPPVELAKLPARSIARWQGETLVATAQGLRSLAPHPATPTSASQAVAAPEGKLDLLSLPTGIVAWGRSAWLREGKEAPWREVAAGVRRVLPTGDPDRPLLIATEREALVAGPSGAILERFDLPFAGRDVLAAERTPRGWALGTSGYGLVLYEPTQPPPAAPAVSAGSR
jgi:hypothetical protein